MRTLKITLIATAIATAVSFWAGELGLMKKLWPDHPQMPGFLLALVTCIAVQILWPLVEPKRQGGKS